MSGDFCRSQTSIIPATYPKCCPNPFLCPEKTEESKKPGANYLVEAEPSEPICSKEPISIEWPPVKPVIKPTSPPKPATKSVSNGTTNCGQMGQMPYQMFQIVHEVPTTIIATPQQIQPSQEDFRMEPAKATKESQTKNEREIRMPEFKRQVRGPPQRCGPWIQCVENSCITDQVRRPMARICHKRPVPPIVIPIAKYHNMIWNATEKDRKEQELKQRQLDRETCRLNARQRQSKWNYTVESLLERKKQKELEREQYDLEDVSQLVDEVKQEKVDKANAQLVRAKKLMLYRKGLIRDFHSALGYSKMMQEIDEIKALSTQVNDESESMAEKCIQKMIDANTTKGIDDLNLLKDMKKAVEIHAPPKSTETKAPVKVPTSRPKRTNPKLKAILKKSEVRKKEITEEMNKEISELQQLEIDSGFKPPKTTPKPMFSTGQGEAGQCEQPFCDDNQKEKKEAEYRAGLYKAIQENLAADAFIASTEKEIDRQACRFIEYKREVDAIQKAKEKQMIEEKVEYHIRKSEAAAKVLIELQKEKAAKANVYDGLKDKWDAEFKEKANLLKSAREKKLEKVVMDFNDRKLKEGAKRCELDPARQWAREQLVAEENMEKECERANTRRQQAEEIAEFNKAQVQEKVCRESRKKYLDDVWGLKMKQEYLDEMKEMKSYANDCIEDWKAKGRSPFPMIQAMKKWDYDAGMYPYLFNEGYLARRQSQNTKEANCPTYETTSKRLGFNSGGC